MIPNKSTKIVKSQFVVNCFQNCIFTYDSQLNKLIYEELELLWIAFRIVFLLMIPNLRSLFD